MYIIYYMKNNYMFRPFSLVIFRLINVYTCLTQLYDGRDMYIIYYIKNNYMFRPLSLAIFRLINKKT